MTISNIRPVSLIHQISLRITFPKVEQQAGGKWLIHSTESIQTKDHLIASKDPDPIYDSSW